MDPGSILWRALFFLLLLLFFSFFPLLFFFSLSLFQLDGSIPTRSQFYSYHSFSFFPSLALFFLPFCPPLTFPLPSFFFLSPILFPFHSFFLFPSFCYFSFSLSSLSSFLPPPCPNACPPPTTPSKNPGENTAQDTPPIGTGRTQHLYGFINKSSREKPLFSPHHRPHTHSWDSFPFTEAQLTQPSLFDHRTHALYGRTGFDVSMALLTKFLGKKHSFHRITAPTHILGTPPLSLRHNKPNPVCSTTGHTP